MSALEIIMKKFIKKNKIMIGTGTTGGAIGLYLGKAGIALKGIAFALPLVIPLGLAGLGVGLWKENQNLKKKLKKIENKNS